MIKKYSPLAVVVILIVWLINSVEFQELWGEIPTPTNTPLPLIAQATPTSAGHLPTDEPIDPYTSTPTPQPIDTATSTPDLTATSFLKIEETRTAIEAISTANAATTTAVARLGLTATAAFEETTIATNSAATATASFEETVTLATASFEETATSEAVQTAVAELPSPTFTPTPTPTLYPPPILTSPDEGQGAYGTFPPLKWEWPNVLAENEYFEVRVWHESLGIDNPQALGLVKERVFDYNVKEGRYGKYYWSVIVVEDAEVRFKDWYRPDIWPYPVWEHDPAKPTESIGFASDESSIRFFNYTPQTGSDGAGCSTPPFCN